MASASGSASRELGNLGVASQPLWSLVPSFMNADEGAYSTEKMLTTALGNKV